MTAGPGVCLRYWDGATSLGAVVAVSTRHGGVSVDPYASLNLGLHVQDEATRVVDNRGRAATAFGVTLDDMVFAEQVHGANATFVGASDRGRGCRELSDAIAATDILLTTDIGTTLVMLVADCVPIALIDPLARILAVVHAGWRGTAARAVAVAVGAMVDAGGNPANINAFLGPAVSQSRYQVDEPVYRSLREAVDPTPLLPAVALADGPDRWLIDLIAANRQQLVL
ncbi:MAG TPA: polyphenol oxidase family protein, partial [Acidimicrobiales bacterium]